jgi:hypothetical protein
MATKEFNLELAKVKAKARSQGSDLTEVTADLLSRNRNQILRNPRNGGSERVSLGSRETIAQKREQSRNTVLKAWVCSMPPTVDYDLDDPQSYSAIHHQTKYRAFFLRTTAGRDLLRFIAEGGGRQLGKMLVNFCLLAHQVRVSLSSKNVIEGPIQVYIDLRKDMWARVEKTGDFTNLIQRQERLLQRISTTLAFVMSDRYLAKLMGADYDYMHTFRTMFASHLHQLPLGTVGEIQQTAFMLEAIFSHCDIGMVQHKIARGREVMDVIDECNPLLRLAKSIATMKRTTGDFNPDE